MGNSEQQEIYLFLQQTSTWSNLCVQNLTQNLHTKKNPVKQELCYHPNQLWHDSEIGFSSKEIGDIIIHTSKLMQQSKAIKV